MSSPVEIVASDLPKSRLSVLSLARRAFSFEGGGTLKDRLLTALVVLIVAVLLTFFATTMAHGGLLTVLFGGFVTILSSFEVARLFARDADTLRYQPFRGAAYFLLLVSAPICAVVLGVESVLVSDFEWRTLYAVTSLSALALVIAQVLEGRREIRFSSHCGERWGSAFLLVSMCGSQLVVVSSMPRGIHLIWWMVAVVALNDAAAYFTGRAVGRTKMAPALSPNKTIEGSVAGIVVGTLAGAFFWTHIVGPAESILPVAIVSALMTVAAQAADLSKSYLKRLRGVKDTGSFFPGHGGVLDRFDGLIGAAPVVLSFLCAGWLR